MKGFRGEAYWILFESNSRPPSNLLSDSLRGALSLSVIDGGDNPVIIAGFGRFGHIVGRLLRANGVGTTVLDLDGDQIDIVRRTGYLGICLVSDPRFPAWDVPHVKRLLADADLALTAIAGHANPLARAACSNNAAPADGVSDSRPASTRTRPQRLPFTYGAPFRLQNFDLRQTRILKQDRHFRSLQSSSRPPLTKDRG